MENDGKAGGITGEPQEQVSSAHAQHGREPEGPQGRTTNGNEDL